MISYSRKPVFRLAPGFCKCTRNSGVSFILLLAMHFTIIVSGQTVCTNPPSLRLSESSGTTCRLSPVTVSGNTFGGSATRVILSENGRGSLTHSSTSSSPFSFTYRPDSHDIGREITITVITNNPEGSPCREASATYLLTVTSSSPLQ